MRYLLLLLTLSCSGDKKNSVIDFVNNFDLNTCFTNHKNDDNIFFSNQIIPFSYYDWKDCLDIDDEQLKMSIRLLKQMKELYFSNNGYAKVDSMINFNYGQHAYHYEVSNKSEYIAFISISFKGHCNIKIFPIGSVNEICRDEVGELAYACFLNVHDNYLDLLVDVRDYRNISVTCARCFE